MSLSDFLYASYALLAEEHQRINPLKEFASVASALQPLASGPVVRTTVADQNKDSMTMLQGMLGNVADAPTRKPRRAR